MEDHSLVFNGMSGGSQVPVTPTSRNLLLDPTSTHTHVADIHTHRQKFLKNVKEANKEWGI